MNNLSLPHHHHQYSLDLHQYKQHNLYLLNPNQQSIGWRTESLHSLLSKTKQAHQASRTSPTDWILRWFHTFSHHSSYRLANQSLRHATERTSSSYNKTWWKKSQCEMAANYRSWTLSVLGNEDFDWNQTTTSCGKHLVVRCSSSWSVLEFTDATLEVCHATALSSCLW